MQGNFLVLICIDLLKQVLDLLALAPSQEFQQLAPLEVSVLVEIVKLEGLHEGTLQEQLLTTVHS
jgi:hypothetical protein